LYGKLNGNKIFIRGNHDRDNVLPYLKEYKVLLNYKNKYKFLLQHRKDVTWPGKENGVILIHGHTHDDKILSDVNSVNVSCEAIGYIPIHIEEILEKKFKIM
jgi:calcineurin-like phosphoesterase family protein